MQFYVALSMFYSIVATHCIVVNVILKGFLITIFFEI